MIKLIRKHLKSEGRKTQEGAAKLGGPGKVVCLDKTNFTTKKKCRGGFQGRSTAGHKKGLIGMVELNLHRYSGSSTRKVASGKKDAERAMNF